jgi:hypothetical protein
MISTAPFSGSYDPRDVEILLKPAQIEPIDVARKEALIQSGARHYSEMLSAESVPDARYLELYRQALERNAGRVRGDIEHLAATIAARPQTRESCVVISLARAGTPIGVLLRRALGRLGVATHHYSISIDEVALGYIRARHGTGSAVFVDGWTGKGSIRGQLERSLAAGTTGFRRFLAVVADPAGCADLAATSEDYVIPSGLLNGIVSGLISRSVLNDAVVGPGDFHACVFQRDHAAQDLSREFVEAVEAAPLPARRAAEWSPDRAAESRRLCQALLEELMAEGGIDDLNRIKPGIAEATRALLRRVPHAVYLKDPGDPEVSHIVHLAHAAGVEVVQRDLHNYRAVTVIRKVGGEQE